jgi:hypothetical protein
MQNVPVLLHSTQQSISLFRLTGSVSQAALYFESEFLMHLSMLTPRVGGSGKGWGFDIFTKKNVKCHSLGRKFLGKIPHPRDEIVFLKYLVSGALYMSGDREITQIHLAV